ncbi:hypothetical protein [Nocardioides sp. cx-173]|uniref:hypothetical protein n=1 Tax=Nocardioides sp. cx-173 TaxID=2898796 RepID=UPI001E5E5CA9|nr:hypothetical protein [Nocardioides sp. cx-173]MCD4525968.1 hypothetical protein [Nocardioides sp. cx-173]UGB43665.1 hypothetical protein LQ940_09105 [Nocardioides sp. cx-173]
MIESADLTLLIGPGVPVPAPRSVMEAVSSVRVTTGPQQSGFQVVFEAGRASDLLRTLLPVGYFDPIVSRVIVMVTIRGLPHVLIDGVVTHHELTPSNTPGASTLTITGEDLSVLMDLVEMPFMRYPAMPEVTQLYAILAKYAVFGIAPIVVPPIVSAVRNPLEGIDTHTGTDLDYIQQHAARCGYVFHLDPGPLPGSSIAYFGPDVRVPVPQPALSVNLDEATNVDALSFSLDGKAKKITVYTIFDPVTHKVPIPIPVPNLNPFKPPLGLRPTPPARVEFAEDGGPLEPAEAAKRIIGDLMKASDAITGEGSLDVLAYGRPLRARQLVGVRGAGTAYDGLYYVNRVTHDLKPHSYKQSFSLSRDGLISPTPVVPV